MKLFDFRKYPALFTFLPVSAGIILSYSVKTQFLHFPDIYFIGLLVILASAAVYIYSRTSRLYSINYLAYFVITLIFGATSLQFSYYKINENKAANVLNEFKYGNVNIYGTVQDDPDVTAERIRLLVKADSLSQALRSVNYNGAVLISVYKNKFSNSVAGDYKAGDIIQINGRLEPLPHRRNPGEFDYGEYLKMHDFEAVFSATGFENIKKTGETDAGFYKTKVLALVKNYINEIIDRNPEGDEREFLRGLLLGDKSNISRETRDDFVNAGVAHIIAVSGLNVAYVLIILSGLLLLIPIPRVYKNIIIILSILFYMNLTGNSPSIVRATIMAVIFLLAQMFERRPNSYNVISFAALVIIIIDPRQLFDSGFILSFAAILSIVIINPILENILNQMKWYNSLHGPGRVNSYTRNVILLFVGTLAAQIGTIPVTAIMFKNISVVSLIVNMFAIPISNINLALGFVSVFTSLFSSWLAMIFASFNNFLMFYLLKAISFSARLDYSYIETYRMDILLFVVYYTAIFFLFSINKKNYLPRLILVIFLLSNFMVYESVLAENQNARVTYLDVGNSNCSLISMPGGTNILVNAGTSSLKYSSAERNVLPYLKREGISKIDLLVITAIDANELRNLKYLLHGIDVKRMLIPVYYKPVFENTFISKTFSTLYIDYVDSCRVINSKGNFRLYLYYDNDIKGPSMLADFVYGSKSFLFDDAEDETDAATNYNYMKNNPALTSLRVPLYGSFEFTKPEYIVKTAPSVVVISSQKDRNKINETDLFEQTLDSLGYKVLSAAKRGAVILETDGERTKLVEWK